MTSKEFRRGCDAAAVSIPDIAEATGLSRSTVAHFSRGLPVSPASERKLSRAVEAALRARARELQRLGVIPKPVATEAPTAA